MAILPQPRHHNSADFLEFGKPRLFFGVTSGNLDSIVANYTGNGKVRDFDAYSANGNPWWPGEAKKANRKRPDRATIVYANLARAAYTDVPVILGGVEASLRRFVHYDYKQQKLRGSVLTDGKADLLAYGMAEKAIVEAALAIKEKKNLTGINGTCERMTEQAFREFTNQHAGEDEMIILPSWEDIQRDRSLFLDAELMIDKHARSRSSKILVQKQQTSWLIQHPPVKPLTEEDLDKLYNLPFTRTPHPRAGNIPAYQMIRDSITIVRGCSGNCSFCAITRHQGPTPSSRSRGSILQEAKRICAMDDFGGTISDLGGPTANLFATYCKIGGCKKHDCLFPKVCEHLEVNEKEMLLLLEDVVSLEEVKHVFISSGLRMELLLKTPKLMKKLLASHTPGSLKIAPEHTEDGVLEIMHKEPHEVLCNFVNSCKKIEKALKKKVHLTPYIITGHPGSSEKSALNLVKKMKRLGLTVRQFQDFTPTPGTLSTAMFVSQLDSKGRCIHMPSPAEKLRQRKIIEQAFHKRNAKRRAKHKKRP